MKEVFVPKRPIYKNLSHFLHKYYRMRDTCASLQPIFHTIKICFKHIFVEPILIIWSTILGNWERFISKTYLYTINSFTFYIYILYWEITRYHWTQILQNFWSRMHKERRQLVIWMPHHQLRVEIKFEFSSLSSPIHKK